VTAGPEPPTDDEAGDEIDRAEAEAWEADGRDLLRWFRQDADESA
jgi:hypothetical protein